MHSRLADGLGNFMRVNTGHGGALVSSASSTPNPGTQSPGKSAMRPPTPGTPSKEPPIGDRGPPEAPSGNSRGDIGSVKKEEVGACAQYCRWMLVKLALLVALMSAPSTSVPQVASANEVLDAEIDFAQAWVWVIEAPTAEDLDDALSTTLSGR